MADVAKMLGDMIQVLLGPVHTTKLHRLMYHVHEELTRRGNLWEGDTSENESLHPAGKMMYRRTNKHGPSLMLQLLRAEETKSEVLDRLDRAERDADKDARATAGVDDDAAGGAAEADPRVGARGVRVSAAAVAAQPGLAALPACLEVGMDGTLAVANTTQIKATFEWGARAMVQNVRGTNDFRAAPWHSHIRFVGADGEVLWGLVRVVLRGVDGGACQRVVVQCLRKETPRNGCVLTAFGCQRLAWDFASWDDDWPKLAVVETSAILRLEQIHSDWWDLGRRLGVRAVPSTVPDTSDERHRARFFTNVFYPWTSRSLRLAV